MGQNYCKARLDLQPAHSLPRERAGLVQMGLALDVSKKSLSRPLIFPLCETLALFFAKEP